MSWLFVFITCSVIGWWLANVASWMRPIRKGWKKLLGTARAKPFDCAFCMSFWTSFAAYFTYSTSWLELGMLSLATAIMGMTIEMNQK